MKYLNKLRKPTIAPKVILLALVASGACSLTSKALAEGFDTFSDQQRLENQVIIASGNIGKRMSAASSSSDTSYFDRQKQTVFEIGRFCFKSSDAFEDISGKAGLLLLDKYSHSSVAVVTESISTIKIKMTGVTVMDCASLTIQEGKQLQNQLQQQLEALKQQRAAFDQMIKDQRAATKKTP